MHLPLKQLASSGNNFETLTSFFQGISEVITYLGPFKICVSIEAGANFS